MLWNYYLYILIGFNLKRKQIAFRLGLTDNQLKWKMERALPTSMRSKYASISENHLKELISQIVWENEELGEIENPFYTINHISFNEKLFKFRRKDYSSPTAADGPLHPTPSCQINFARSCE